MNTNNMASISRRAIFCGVLNFLIVFIALFIGGGAAYGGYLSYDEITYRYLDADDREAIVLIHGWTGEDTENAPTDSFGRSEEWTNLIDALKARNAGTGIKVLPFHWEAEASTGEALDYSIFGIQGFYNARDAAFNGFSQGTVLANSIHANGPNLRKITFIAHSAGTWVAYRALDRLLTLNPYVVAQVVLLDPFIPGVDPSVPTSLNTATISDLATHTHRERIWRMENYHSIDVTDVDFDWGNGGGSNATSQYFSWRSSIDINKRVDYQRNLNIWLNYYGDEFIPATGIPIKSGHAGPIQFYSDTVVAATPGGWIASELANAPWIFTDYGFYRSMTHQSYLLPQISSQPTSKTIQLGQIKATDVLSISAVRATQIKWIRHSDKAVVGTGSTLSLASFTASDAGTYVAELSNSAGLLYSDAVQVTVQSVPPPSPTRVIALSGDMTFGNVPVGSRLMSNLTVSNNGNSPLTVSALTLPSGYSYANVGVVPAGGSINIPIEFSPTAAQIYSGNITVVCDKTSGTNTYAVSGTGFTATGTTRLISLTGDMTFGSVVVGSNLARTLTITNSGNAALSVTGLTLPSGFYGSWSGSIAIGGSQTVTVTFTPSAATSYSGNISVQSNATGGTASKAASGTGAVSTPPAQPILTLSSTSLPFGSGAGSGELVVRNDGTGTMNWTASSNATWARVLDTSGSLSAGSGEWLGIAVDANPNTTARTATISVQAPGATGAPKSFVVTQAAQPVTRIISITGLANFEDTTPGIPLSKIFTVRNLGNTLLRVYSATSPEGFSAYAAFNIVPGGSNTFTIRFNPTVGGLHTGNVVLSTDATSGGNQVSVHGTSVLPPVGMSWTKLNAIGSGTVELIPPGTPFVQGTQLHPLSATPRIFAQAGDDYYVSDVEGTGGPFFDWALQKKFWSGGANSNLWGETVDQPFPVVGNHSATVTFSQKPIYSIVATTASGGNVAGMGPIKWGEVVTLRAAPDEGFAFTGWTGGANIVSYDQEYFYRVYSDASYAAGFVFDNEPLTPSGVAPASGAIRVPVKPTLSASAFQDPDAGDTYAASEWIVRRASDGALLYSSGRISPGSANHTVSRPLPYDEQCSWQVRYWDQKGGISPFSIAIPFRTRPSNPPGAVALKPNNATRTPNQDLFLRPGMFDFSATFSDPDPEDSLRGSQWIIQRLEDAAIVHDSGTRNSTRNYYGYGLNVSLTEFTTYSWQVRFKDSEGVWGDYSQPAYFTTEPPPRNFNDLAFRDYVGTVNTLGVPSVEIGKIRIVFRNGRPSMTLNGKVYTAGGSLSENGYIKFNFVARGVPDAFQLCMVLPNHPSLPSGAMQGVLQTAPWTPTWGDTALTPFATVILEESSTAFGKTNPSPFTGYYTLTLPADPTRPEIDYPQGHGFAGITVKPDGTARVVGVLGDGKPFSASGAITTEGRLLIWTAPYNRKGTFGGWIQFTEGTTSDAETLAGNLTWTRPTAKKGDFLSGFTGSVAASGSRYTRPMLAAEILGQPATPLNVELDDGVPQAKQFAFPSAKSAVAKHPSGSSLKIATKTGFFTGKFRAQIGKLLPYRGAIVQNEGAGFGLFKRTGNYGQVIVEKAVQ
jgi:pimeloyl-ACP methyl ester carboxylesterase